MSNSPAGQPVRSMTSLNGETKLFIIIGDPIAQVKSPALLTANMHQRGINAVVVPGHVLAADIEVFMAGCDALVNLEGIVATIPHKQAMLGHCATITERARYANSVNVMRRTGAGWSGDNTDGMGYVSGIKAAGGTIEGKRVLLIGAGGAGSAIAYEFLAQGAAHLDIHDVDIARRDALIARLEDKFAGKVAAGSNDPRGYDIVGNATPLGMKEGDPLPVLCEHLDAGQFVADVITKPEISPLIAAARSKGCNTMPGLGMFKAQEGLLVDALLGNPYE